MDIGFELHLDTDEFHTSAIYAAIKCGNHQKLLAAIQNGQNVHLCDPDFTSTYLHVVVSHATSIHILQYVPMIYQLSNASIDVNATDYKGRLVEMCWYLTPELFVLTSHDESQFILVPQTLRRIFS